MAAEDARREYQRAYWHSRRDAQRAAAAYDSAAKLRAWANPDTYAAAREGDALFAASLAAYDTARAASARAREFGKLADAAAIQGASTKALRAEIKARRKPARDKNANPTNAQGVYYETGAYHDMVERTILGYGRRIGKGDIDHIADLLALHAVVEDAIGLAARELTRPSRKGDPDSRVRNSWTDVGDQLGKDRRTAWENYHNPDGNRRLRGTQLKNGQDGQDGQAA